MIRPMQRLPIQSESDLARQARYLHHKKTERRTHAAAPRSDSWSDSEFKTQIRLEYLILIHRIDTDVVPNSAGAD
jgi:hypothetical protein